MGGSEQVTARSCHDDASVTDLNPVSTMRCSTLGRVRGGLCAALPGAGGGYSPGGPPAAVGSARR
ncbi:hypothetical protein [Ornithinimicrobium kibberense]|uniref:hypothetical protein n=1 Tax=Ornithinimicrobium kibberense TaxID=282060 RepID=UPI0036194BB8